MTWTRIDMKIAITGNGNVAYHLIPALRQKNVRDAYEVVQITTNADNLVPDADIYLLLVPDGAIYELAETLRLPNKIIAHASGATPLKAISAVSSNVGVFYPVQTFSKDAELINFENVPICIEASNEKTEKVLANLARLLSHSVHKINSENRAKIHLACTFANNFTNALYSISEKILQEIPQADISLLLPIIEQTARKIKTVKPIKAQTGAAMRNDTVTIEKHLQILQSEPHLKNAPQLQELYRLFTEIIRNR